MMSACKVRKKDHGAQAEQSVFLRVQYALVPVRCLVLPGWQQWLYDNKH
jgi:hypothetical protein